MAGQGHGLRLELTRVGSKERLDARFQERLSNLAAAARSNMRTIHTPHRDNPSCL